MKIQTIAREKFELFLQKISADGTLTDVSAPTGPMEDEEAYNAISHDAMQLYGQGMGLLFLSSYTL